MRRLFAVMACALVSVPCAGAWTWPVDGPILRPFAFGPDPYAGGQHRGIDIAAPAGAPVRAPASGQVSFSGTVPGGGRTVSIRTVDGYSVTLLHLGSLSVARGTTVAEGDAVGTVGPTGEVQEQEPYVYLGIRVAADPQGYVDPVTLLPSRVAPPTGAAPAPPATAPAVPAPALPAPAADVTAPVPAPVETLAPPIATADPEPAGAGEPAAQDAAPSTHESPAPAAGSAQPAQGAAPSADPSQSPAAASAQPAPTEIPAPTVAAAPAAPAPEAAGAAPAPGSAAG